MKLDYIPITRVENACATATDAFRNAAYAVAAGIYDIVLAVGVEKLKDSGFSGLASPRLQARTLRRRPRLLRSLQWRLPDISTSTAYRTTKENIPWHK